MVNLEKQITFNDGLDEQDLEVPVGELEARFDREELGRLALEQEESRENPIDYVEIAYEKIKGLILRHRYISVLTVAVLTAIIISLTLLTIVLPQTIKFDFLKEQSCVFSPSLLPNLLKSDTKEFNLSRPAAMTYKQTPLFSLKVCATAVEAPIANENFTISQKLRIANYNLVNKTITVATGNYINASIDLDDKQVKSLTLTKPINFKLEQADRVFDYYLAADDKSVKCEKNALIVSCPLTSLTLAYDTKYELKLIRQFKDKTLETILTKTIKTIDAVAIISSSISNGSIVYDKPEQMLIETSKTLKSVGQAGASYQENDKSVAFPLTVSFKGKQITISFKEPLPRQKAFTFKLTNVTATDSSQFEQELKIDFEVSGGPKIVAVNIPSYGVEQQPAIRLTFDQELEKEQNLYEKIGFYVEGKPASAGISLNGNSVTVRPGSYMPICAKFKIIVNEKVTSPYGISGDSAWIFDSRVVCHSTFSIGSSVRNRPITAYQFGNSSKIILFVGAMHGNEKNTKNLLHKWIDSLNAHPEKLPSGNSIVVIPVVNPDGVAANTRRNANDIDLNRNFPTSNWQTEVTEPDSNGALTTAGGPSPLSEPESAALASFAQSRNICLALTYHSQAGLIQANDAADSYSIAETYSDLAGYRAIHTYNLGEVFDYNTNGAFEDWMGEKLGLPALLIELYSGTNDEFYLNESAMWAMTKIN